jgi:hypothetical protein
MARNSGFGMPESVNKGAVKLPKKELFRVNSTCEDFTLRNFPAIKLVI